jgi:putative ABC transport system substrate-binding protein
MKPAGIAFATSAVRRREFIALMGASVTWSFAAMAQEPGRTYRLGALWAGSTRELWTAFLDPARRHGFIEGRNLTVERREFAQHLDLLSDWADELTKSRVDVIAAAGDPAIRAVQKATKTIPILATTAIWLGQDWLTRWLGRMEIGRALVFSQPSLTANDRKF